MTVLHDSLEAEVAKICATTIVNRKGQTVPEAEDIRLGNDAVELHGTVLYADLSESTGLVDGYKPWFAAKVYKSYLLCAAKIIRARGGVITAYDGDRVMAVFIGATKDTDAAKCALQVNYATKKVVQPALRKQYPKNNFTVKQTVGIDTSELLVARTGIRGSNDLVWVGRAANYAAKMAGLPPDYATYLSADVYTMLHDSSKLGGDPKRNMWTKLGKSIGGVALYGSNFWWSV